MGKLNWTVTYSGQAGWDKLDEAEIKDRVKIFQDLMRDTYHTDQYKVISVLRETKRRPHTYAIMLKCGKKFAEFCHTEWDATVSGGIVIVDPWGDGLKFFSNVKELRRFSEGTFRQIVIDMKRSLREGVEETDPIYIRRQNEIQRARMALLKIGFNATKLAMWNADYAIGLCYDMIVHDHV